jgi:hypothetical protein
MLNRAKNTRTAENRLKQHSANTRLAAPVAIAMPTTTGSAATTPPTASTAIATATATARHSPRAAGATPALHPPRAASAAAAARRPGACVCVRAAICARARLVPGASAAAWSLGCDGVRLPRRGRSRSPSPGHGHSLCCGRARSPSRGRARSPCRGRARAPSPGRGRKRARSPRSSSLSPPCPRLRSVAPAVVHSMKRPRRGGGADEKRFHGKQRGPEPHDLALDPADAAYDPEAHTVACAHALAVHLARVPERAVPPERGAGAGAAERACRPARGAQGGR